MASRKSLALGSDGHPQQIQNPDVLLSPGYTVAQLLAMTGVLPGSKAYASNGRALTGAGLGTIEASPGNGVEVTYTSAGTWKIVGTTITVSA